MGKSEVIHTKGMCFQLYCLFKIHDKLKGDQNISGNLGSHFKFNTQHLKSDFEHLRIS